MKAKLGAVWAWLKRWWWILAGGLVAVLTAGILWDDSKRRTANLADELKVSSAKAKVAGLDAHIADLTKQDGVTSGEIAMAHAKREAIQRQAVALSHDVSGMSPKDVEDAFRRLY